MSFEQELERMPDLLRRLALQDESTNFIVIYARDIDEGSAFGYASTEMTTDRLVFLLERAKFVVLHDLEGDDE